MDGGENLRLRITSPRELSVQKGDGSAFVIHPMWLRERCQDAQCVDRATRQRLYDPSDLDPNLGLTAVSEPAPGRLHVRFSDGHEAEFSAAEILAEASLAPGDADCPPLQLWDGAFTQLPRARWRAQPSGAELFEWVSQFLRWGFIIFSSVPTEQGAILNVAAKFGFTRTTNFGELFNVRSAPDANDLAYTSIALDPHTDNPYRSPVPGVQLLHCLVNETSGGLSTLVDAFAVAETLRQRDPEAFRILAGTSVRFRFTDQATELTASAAPIDLDVTGRVRAVHFSPRLDFVPLLPPEQLNAYYHARRAFDHMLRAPEFEIRFLLAPGDLLMMDNCRLLHGRTGFDPGEGLRYLQGCYIDIDGPRSLYRVLRRRSMA
jgi:gamma-butyrobetaine dioxygenase